MKIDQLHELLDRPQLTKILKNFAFYKNSWLQLNGLAPRLNIPIKRNFAFH